MSDTIPSQSAPGTTDSLHAPEMGSDLYVMDPDGDLLLRVGAEHDEPPADFIVCSASMRRSSPFWKVMLFGPWLETKPTEGKWVVALPEDQPSTFRILFAIIHGKYELVPKTMTPGLLYDILKTTDKYDLLHMIRPWALAWKTSAMESLKSSKGETDFTLGDRLRLAYAAWEMGDEDDVIRMINEFTHGMTAHQLDALREECQLQNIRCGPPDLLDMVEQNRLAYIQEILDFAHDEITKRMSNDSSGGCRDNSAFSIQQRAICNSTFLGSIWQTLAQSKHRQGVLPKTANDIHESALEFVRDMADMISFIPPRIDGHENCTPVDRYLNFFSKMRSEKWRENLLDAEHKARLETQRKKTGL